MKALKQAVLVAIMIAIMAVITNNYLLTEGGWTLSIAATICILVLFSRLEINLKWFLAIATLVITTLMLFLFIPAGNEGNSAVVIQGGKVRESPRLAAQKPAEYGYLKQRFNEVYISNGLRVYVKVTVLLDPTLANKKYILGQRIPMVEVIDQITTNMKTRKDGMMSEQLSINKTIDQGFAEIVVMNWRMALEGKRQ